MTLSKDKKILIVGLGLLGGSYAKALIKKGYKVSAITKDQSSVDYALNNRIVDFATTKVDAELLGDSDIVIFALYPRIFIDWIKQNQDLFKSGAVITDVTGVKGSVVKEIQSVLRKDVEFIAAHPMAGREVSGVENSDEGIFRGANYIVVPTESNTEDTVKLCCDLGYELGFSRVSKLSVTEHDKMIGFLSQLTHCIAISLMCANNSKGLENYTGDSFRDLTRIAKINDEMWSELFMLNRDVLLDEMDNFSHAFNKLYNTLKEGNVEEMRDMMRLSTKRRKLFDKKG